MVVKDNPLDSRRQSSWGRRVSVQTSSFMPEKLFKLQYHRRCQALEAALEATDEGWNIFPAIFGRCVIVLTGRVWQSVSFECPASNTCSWPSATHWLLAHTRRSWDAEVLSKVGCWRWRRDSRKISLPFSTRGTTAASVSSLLFSAIHTDAIVMKTVQHDDKLCKFRFKRRSSPHASQPVKQRGCSVVTVK